MRLFLKYIIIFGCLCTSVVGFSKAKAQELQPKKKSLKKIVIDPGHGGSDYGASGNYSHEKDISLAVSLKLEEELKKMLPDVDIYLTRKEDVYDNVKVKAEKANAAAGNLFISIHCNDAAPNYGRELIGYDVERYKVKKKWHTRKVPKYRRYVIPSTAKGTETYIWGIDKNDEKEKAIKEYQQTKQKGADSSFNSDYMNYEPQSPEEMVAINLRMQQYAQRSKNLAFAVQDEFVNIGRSDRSVRQRPKGIWVLQAVAMPAILIELGFVSNPEEEAYLNSFNGQKGLAEAIAKAVVKYKQGLEEKIKN